MHLTTWRTVYKLTDANGRTSGSTQWGPNVTNPAGKRSGVGGLCSPGFYHWYTTPELAAFLNPIHGSYPAPRFWLAEMRGTVKLDGPDGVLKGGSTELRTVREMPAVVPTTEQRVRFAIYCAAAQLDAVGLLIPDWDNWVTVRLEGDRSESVAKSAARSAESAESAAWSAASAAWSAARSAESAESAAWSAASAAWSAVRSAARSAASAAIILDAAAWALSED